MKTKYASKTTAMTSKPAHQ